MFCPLAGHFIRCLVLVQPRKTRPDITEKILTKLVKRIKMPMQLNVLAHAYTLGVQSWHPRKALQMGFKKLTFIFGRPPVRFWI